MNGIAAVGYTARHRMDGIARNRGWEVNQGAIVTRKGAEQPLSTYRAGGYQIDVVWTLSDHVSRAKLVGNGLADDTPDEWWWLDPQDRWNKRFCWVAVRLYDLAPNGMSIVPHARARSEAS